MRRVDALIQQPAFIALLLEVSCLVKTTSSAEDRANPGIHDDGGWRTATAIKHVCIATDSEICVTSHVLGEDGW
jgi:hypothetical protein